MLRSPAGLSPPVFVSILLFTGLQFDGLRHRERRYCIRVSILLFTGLQFDGASMISPTERGSSFQSYFLQDYNSMIKDVENRIVDAARFNPTFYRITIRCLYSG